MAMLPLVQTYRPTIFHHKSLQSPLESRSYCFTYRIQICVKLCDHFSFCFVFPLFQFRTFHIQFLYLYIREHTKHVKNQTNLVTLSHGVMMSLLDKPSPDIDECSDPNITLCNGRGTCINQPGFYQCDCNEGYLGSTCEEICK